jgi:dipeptidyl aminopeptidase/acylaminoacyl peptidase
MNNLKPILVGWWILSCGLFAAAGATEAGTPERLPPQAHGRLPDITLAQISPDGERVAFVRQFAGLKSLSIVVPGKSRLSAFTQDIYPVYDGTPAPKPDSLNWVSDDVLVMDHTVTLPPDKERAEPEDYDGVLIFQKSENGLGFKRSSVWGYVVNSAAGPAGHPLLAVYDKKGLYLTRYVAGVKKPERLDIQTGRGPGGSSRSAYWYPSPDGVVRTRSLLTGPPTESFRIEVRDATQKDGWRTVWKSLDAESDFSPLGFETDPDLLMGLVESPDRRWAVSALDLRTGTLQPVRIAAGKYDIARAVRDLYSSRIVGYAYTAESAEVIWVDEGLATLEKTARAAFPGRHVILDSWSRDRSTFLVLVEGPGDPGAYWVIRGEGKPVKIGDLHPAIPASSVADIRPYHYRARDGLEIDGYLTLPPGRPATKLPLIIMPHGGPASRDSLEFDWWAQALAARGYAVLQPNFRGSDGFGRQFEEAGSRQWGGAMQNDLSDGLAALVGDGVVDPQRVCIVGASYGGYAALAGATLTPDLYRCAISVAGVSDLPDMIAFSRDAKGRDSFATRYWSRIIGDPTTDAEILKARSPKYQAAQAKAPVLLLHGRNDTVVPVIQSIRMREALQSAGKEVVYFELDGEDHNLRNETTRTQMLAYIYDFLDRTNPADHDPAP